MTSRITKLNNFLKKKNLDAFLITAPENVRYISGSGLEDSYLLIAKTGNVIITDFRYKEDAGEVPGFQVKLIEGGFPDVFKKVLKDLGVRKVGFESDDLSYNKAGRLKRALAAEKIRLEPLVGIVEGLRTVKDEDEIRKIKKAVSIAKKALRALKIRPGVSEKTLAYELDCLIRRSGGEKSAFPTIAAAGRNSSRPHAAVTDRRIGRNDLVLVDYGVRADMYNCDLTRVFFLGKIKRLLYDIYDICKEAQIRAIKAVRPGVKASEIDKAARGYIASKGFGKDFGHAVGHGVGLAVHELPQISQNSDQILMPNMVFTIEPGIYIEKVGGVRIEDMVLVTEKGCEVLSDDISK